MFFGYYLNYKNNLNSNKTTTNTNIKVEVDEPGEVVRILMK